MRADKKAQNKPRVLKKFNPCFTTAAKIVADLKLGDIREAENQGHLLAVFLHQLAENPRAISSLIELGVGFVPSAEIAKFIAVALQKESGIEMGKQHKSGAKSFAKILVPLKPTQSQSQARHIAAVLYQLGSDSEENLVHATEIINNKIVANNKILMQFKSGARDDLEGFNPALPTYIITARKAQTAYRRYINEIKTAEA
jgi:hypothetical protein